MPLHLYLIRHGETTWSLTHQHTGRTDIPLTEHGEEEARQLGKRLSGTRFAHVFSSPSQRAEMTCTLVGLSQGAEIEPDLLIACKAGRLLSRLPVSRRLENGGIH